MLALAQIVDENDLPVGKFQSIVVHARIGLVDLPKPRHGLRKPLVAGERPTTLVLDLFLECDFRAGKQAHGHVQFANRRKTAGYRATELGRYQLVVDPREPYSSAVTVVLQF